MKSHTATLQNLLKKSTLSKDKSRHLRQEELTRKTHRKNRFLTYFMHAQQIISIPKHPHLGKNNLHNDDSIMYYQVSINSIGKKIMV